MRTKRLRIVELCLLLMLAACTKRIAVGPPPKLPAPPPPPSYSVALGEADRAFAAKEYDDACRAYEDYLRLAPANEPQDQVLFRLGMSYTLRKAADWQRAQAVWKRLIAEYPNSALKPQVDLILALYSEVSQASADVKVRDDRIRQLSTELDRLKKIDSERRKTP